MGGNRNVRLCIAWGTLPLRGKWIVLAALFLVPILSPVSAQEPEGGFRLKYVQDAWLPIFNREMTDTTEVAFKREPDFQGHNVVRSILAGEKGESTALYFAYDLDAHRLYVDLNRNLDLTDDPKGVFDPANGFKPGQDKIEITVPQQSGNVTYFFSIFCSKDKRGLPSSQIGFCSGWTGKIILAGKTYLVVIVDKPDGTLGTTGRFFLSEWTEGMDVKNLSDYSRDYPRDLFKGIPHHLFLDGKYYELGYEYTSGEAEKADLMFTVKPTEVPLGTLAFEGENLRQVVLRDKLNGPVCVVLDRPGPTVQVPVGNYETASVILASDEQDRYLLKGELKRKFFVTTGQSTPLRVGAPLKAVLSAKDEWFQLVFQQSYLGIGDEKYALIGKNKPEGPPFVISKKGQTVANCKFCYG